MLLSSAPLLHNNLLIAVTVIVLGFLGMLLQRNALATVFSLLLWLQGIGLVFISYAQHQGSREGQFYFLIILLVVITLLSTMAALIFLKRRFSENTEPNTPHSVALKREGTHPGG